MALKNICFTLNNYTDIDIAKLESSDIFDYLIYGKEKGKEGTPHLQGYMELSRRTAFNTIKKALGDRYHIERRRGPQKKAIEYCKKDGDWKELGAKIVQGSRTDLSELKDMALNSDKSIYDILPHINNMQQLKFAQNLLLLRRQKNTYIKKTVYWYYGPTGTGKTKEAFALIGENPYWRSKLDSRWFDGYSGQEYVLIDDLRAKNWPYEFMLSLLDGYPLSVPVKGGFVDWIPKIIIITSPYHPEECYNGQITYHDNIKQLNRRINIIKQFKEEPEPVIPTMFNQGIYPMTKELYDIAYPDGEEDVYPIYN